MKTNKDAQILALENKRLKKLLMEWSPPQLVELLRKEIELQKTGKQATLAQEISEMRHGFMKETTEIIKEIAELREVIAKEKYKHTGVLVQTKKYYRKMGAFVSSFLAERGER